MCALRYAGLMQPWLSRTHVIALEHNASTGVGRNGDDSLQRWNKVGRSAECNWTVICAR
jgi:hypothetical protein